MGVGSMEEAVHVARAGLNAQRLTTAGAELADEIGFDQVTVSALARHVGVAVASLYSHVRGSDDLRTRIALLALAELADRAADAVAGRAGGEALAALAGAYRDYGRDHPGRYAAARLRLDPAAAAASAGGRHTRLLRAVLHGYRLPEQEQTHAVRLIGATIHGYIDLEAAGGFSHSDPDPQDSWPRILDALDTLLRHWPNQPTDTDI